MNARTRMFLWEQARLCVWMLAVIAAAVLSCAVASFLRTIPMDFEVAKQAGGITLLLYRTIGGISMMDAKGLADGYSVVGILVVMFGALVPINTVLQLDVYARLLRLPVNTGWLACLWVGVRTVFVALSVTIIIAMRLVFTNVDTSLALLPGICFFLGGFLVLQGAVRLAAAWKEGAAWVTLVVTASLLGLGASALWSVAEEAPFAVLAGCAVTGLPAAVAGVVLRRRGGIVFAMALPRILRREKVYRSVAELPRFTDALAAHTWFEWRRHGLYYPGLCVIGSCIALGIAAAPPRIINVNGETLVGWARYCHAMTHVDMAELLALLLSVPLFSAVIYAVYLAIMDFARAPKSTARFMMTRPLSGPMFARARLRMLGRGVGLGLLWLPVLFVAAAAFYRPGGDFVREVSGELFAPHWNWDGSWEESDGVDVLASLLVYCVCLLMLLSIVNTFSVTVGILLVFWLILTGAFQVIPDTIEMLAQGAFLLGAPLLLLASALGIACYTGLLRVRTAVWAVVAWFAAELLYTVAGTGSWMRGWIGVASLTPMAAGLALIGIALPSWAIGYHARRSGSFFPPRLAGARIDWGEVRSFTRAALIGITVLLALSWVWRSAVRENVRTEMQAARRHGIAPASPKATTAPGIVQMSAAEFNAIFSAERSLKCSIDTGTRRFWADGDNRSFSTPGGAVLPEGAAPMLEEDAAVLASFRPRLESVVRAMLPLADPVRPLRLAPYIGSQGMATALNVYQQCLLSALAGAEAGDSAAIIDGLRTATALLRNFYEIPELFALQHARGQGALQYALVLERVLARQALTAEQCAELRALLPGLTSIENLKAILRVPARDRFWVHNYEKEYGYTGWSGNSEDWLVSQVEEFLLIPDIAYAMAVSEASQVIFSHGRCMHGEAMSWQRYRSERDKFFTTERSEAFRVAHQALHVSDAMISLLTTTLATEEFRARNGAYPQQLAELAPAILPSLPRDWTDSRDWQRGGHPCKYQRFAGTSFKLYVCGQDANDDYGIAQAGGRPGSGDLVLRVSRP